MKIKTLQESGSYASQVQFVSSEMVQELNWWISQASQHNGRPLQVIPFDTTISSDAFKIGWRATSQGINTGGPWTKEEKTLHINYLELLAAFFALKAFTSQKSNVSILLRLDNVTAIALFY